MRLDAAVGEKSRQPLGRARFLAARRRNADQVAQQRDRIAVKSFRVHVRMSFHDRVLISFGLGREDWSSPRPFPFCAEIPFGTVFAPDLPCYRPAGISVSPCLCFVSIFLSLSLSTSCRPCTSYSQSVFLPCFRLVPFPAGRSPVSGLPYCGPPIPGGCGVLAPFSLFSILFSLYLSPFRSNHPQSSFRACRSRPFRPAPFRLSVRRATVAGPGK